MRKKIAFVNLAIAMALVTSFTLLSGPVSAARPQSTTTVTLAGWASTPDEPADLKKVISNFEAKYPTIKVNYEVINNNFESVMKAAFAAGNGPDVLYADEGWAQDFMRTGAFQSLTKYANADKSFHVADFYKGLVKGFSIGKNIYGFPKDYSTLGMFYNKAIFKAVHIAKPPTTLAAFAKDACTIRAYEVKHGNKNTYGAGLPNDQARWQPILQAFGGSVMNGAQTKPTINSPAGVKAIAYWSGLIHKGCAAEPSQVGAGWSGQMFGQVNAAMVFEGGWLLNPMQTTWPKVQYGITPLPAGPKGPGNLAFSVAYAMNAHSKHKTQAWTLLSYLTGRVGEAQWVKLFGVLPARSVLKAPTGSEVFVKGAPYAQPWSFKPGYFNTGGPNATLNNDLDSVAKGHMTAAAAAKDVANAITLWLKNG